MMRLTLRTLLAYLDDTLEPAKAKEIGQKVAESDTARELMERLKQVTRRRRIAAPPVSGGSSKLDPNTIAEYLDNTIAPEEAAEVEAICLSADVHLAEVAACHQILTLVLGEPMSVPPTAKQRMYGLVKGPEAIPFRKPAAAPREKEPEAVRVGRDVDDTLRLGLPPVGAKSSPMSKALLFGGGFAAACLLVVAIWQVLSTANRTTDDKDKDAVVKVDDKTKDADKTDKTKDADAKDVGDKEKKDDKTAPKDDPDKDGDAKDKTKVEKKDEAKYEDIPFKEADTVSIRQAGLYLPMEGKDSAVCLIQDGDKGEWKRLTERSGEVTTGRHLLSFPGCWSTLSLSRGLRLTLCGSMPEILGAPIPVFESRVMLHNHDKLDLDMTIVRGQALLTVVKDKPMQVRVRFANPFDPGRPEHYELLLHGKGTEVLVGLSSKMLEGEPFYPNPKEKRRRGPVNYVVLVVTKGFANVRYGDVTHGRGPVSLFQWNNVDGPGGPFDLKDDNLARREWPLPEKLDEKSRQSLLAGRKAMKEAVANLASRIDGGSVRVKLEESLQATEPTKRIDPKAPVLSRIMLARLTVRAIGSLGDVNDVSTLLEQLDPPKNDEVRRTARDTLIDWLAGDRDNDYILYDLLKDKYNRNQAERILRLMHGLSRPELSKPETYEELIDSLDNSNPIIRELASFRLYLAVPAGWGIGYSAWETQDVRQAAIAAWRALIPPGSVPPLPKKGKG